MESPQSPRSDKVQPPSTIALDMLHAYLSKCKFNPSILALVKDYSSSFVPKSLAPALPPLLLELYNSGFLSASYSQLLTLAGDVNVSVTPAQRTAVEECTRDQSKSHLCFNMRTGRVTVSKLRAVCVTDETMPESISDEENVVYCYCQGPENGAIIGCDNSSCPYGWFHFECLNITAPPQKKTWYCPDCCKLPQFKRRKL